MNSASLSSLADRYDNPFSVPSPNGLFKNSSSAPGEERHNSFDSDSASEILKRYPECPDEERDSPSECHDKVMHYHFIES
jgi:hypothetical protein